MPADKGFDTRAEQSPLAVTREPGEIVLRSEPVAASANAAEVHGLEYNRQARTKPAMFPYGVDWLVVALAFAVSLYVVVVPLVSVLGPKYPRTRNQQAQITAAKTDIQTLEMCIKQFGIDTGQYPSTSSGFQALLQPPTDATNWRGPYARMIPSDPWGTAYQYIHPGVHNTGTYDLSSAGPDKTFGTGDDIVN